jgi:hypothetical protein
MRPAISRTESPEAEEGMGPAQLLVRHGRFTTTLASARGSGHSGSGSFANEVAGNYSSVHSTLAE